MPRLSRAVFAGVPHHVTQRGNRRGDVFFGDDDRLAYLDWLQAYSEKYDVDLLAYCLMTNHVHLVMVPSTEMGLQQVLKPLHMRYAQRVNRARGWKGHLWQGRFFSSPLDDGYMRAAIRYVENNPVRAGLVEKAEDYPWSSAKGHCGLGSDSVLTAKDEWLQAMAGVTDWAGWLASAHDCGKLDILRRNVEKGLPCGSEGFVESLGRRLGRVLQYRPQGSPAKEKNSEKG